MLKKCFQSSIFVTHKPFARVTALLLSVETVGNAVSVREHSSPDVLKKLYLRRNQNKSAMACIVHIVFNNKDDLSSGIKPALAHSFISQPNFRVHQVCYFTHFQRRKNLISVQNKVPFKVNLIFRLLFSKLYKQICLICV